MSPDRSCLSLTAGRPSERRPDQPRQFEDHGARSLASAHKAMLCHRVRQRHGEVIVGRVVSSRRRQAYGTAWSPIELDAGEADPRRRGRHESKRDFPGRASAAGSASTSAGRTWNRPIAWRSRWVRPKGRRFAGPMRSTCLLPMPLSTRSSASARFASSRKSRLLSMNSRGCLRLAVRSG